MSGNHLCNYLFPALRIGNLRQCHENKAFPFFRGSQFFRIVFFKSRLELLEGKINQLKHFSLPVYPQLRIAKIDFVIPHNPVTSLIYADVIKKSIIFKRVERRFLEKWGAVINS
jgi:hypothetical protein